MRVQWRRAVRVSSFCLATMSILTPLAAQTRAYSRNFSLEKCTFQTTGRTPYFVLEPGHIVVLEHGKGVQLTVSVLDRTETVGGIVTRVIEERETRNGKLVAISLNYFAICAENQNVFGIVGMKR